MNEELFQTFDSLTFDDVLIVPGCTEVLPDQTDVRAAQRPHREFGVVGIVLDEQDVDVVGDHGRHRDPSSSRARPCGGATAGGTGVTASVSGSGSARISSVTRRLRALPSAVSLLSTGRLSA